MSWPQCAARFVLAIGPIVLLRLDASSIFREYGVDGISGVSPEARSPTCNRSPMSQPSNLCYLLSEAPLLSLNLIIKVEVKIMSEKFFEISSELMFAPRAVKPLLPTYLVGVWTGIITATQYDQFWMKMTIHYTNPPSSGPWGQLTIFWNTRGAKGDVCIEGKVTNEYQLTFSMTSPTTFVASASCLSCSDGPSDLPDPKLGCTIKGALQCPAGGCTTIGNNQFTFNIQSPSALIWVGANPNVIFQKS